jgi:hypothetical protein
VALKMPPASSDPRRQGATAGRRGHVTRLPGGPAGYTKYKVVRRGAWARVTMGQLRRLALQTGSGT